MLKQQIKEEIKLSLKAGEKAKLNCLRFLMAQILDKEIEKQNKELTDAEVLEVINSQIKKLQESIILFQKGARIDLIDKAKEEIEIIKAYLPKQLTDGELDKEIEKIIQENPHLPHPGALIGLAVKALVGKADNQRISQMVLGKLNNNKTSGNQ